jgi:hypothetical protein
MADIRVFRNTSFTGDDEGSRTAGFRYLVDPGDFHTGTTGAGQISVRNDTDYPIAVTLKPPIGDSDGEPIAPHDEQTVHLNAAGEDAYAYTVLVNEGHRIFRAHGASNPRIVYP